MFEHLYRHIIDKIPAGDIALIYQACGLPWEEINYNKAESAEAREAMHRIMNLKIRMEEARMG